MVRYNWRLYVLMLPALIWLGVFVYYPMYGLVIVFKDFRARAGITALSGGDPVLFMARPEYFRPVYILSNIWQTMGFSAIIYIAALTGISPDFYEAAIIDGANKLQRIWYIDIPFIIPTAIIMFILAVGNIMTIGYEKVYLMQNGMNTVVSEIISTYVYKTGLQSAQYSFATAVGLFNSAVNFVILILCNGIAKKSADISIF